MGYRRNEFDDDWDGYEINHPREGRSWSLWAAAGAAIIVVLCMCAAGSYLLYQEFLAVPPTSQAPILPTVPGGEMTATALATPLPPPTAASTLEPPPTPEIVPTVTLQGQATPPPITTDTNIEAIRLDAAPVIDGELSEWAPAPAFVSVHLVHSAPGWDGTNDVTAIWQLAWDSEHLYVGVDVTDNIHVQIRSDNQAYRGDSLDMQFDTDRAGDFGDGLSPDDYQFILSPGDFGAIPEMVFRFRGTEGGRIPDFPGHNVILKAQKTASGYRLEAAIPWQDIGMSPEVGLVLGLALNANDNDTPGTAVQEVMMSHVASRTLTDPSGWGTLILQ